MSTSIRVACYARCSTEEQAEKGISIEAQKEYCRAWADRMGWRRTLFYPDPGFSGKDRERPMLKRMMEDAKIGWDPATKSRDPSKSLWDMVIASNNDRLSRDSVDSEMIKRELLGMEIRIEFGNMPGVDVGTASGKFVSGVMDKVAQYQRDDIIQKTKQAMALLKSQGKHCGTIPWGFELDENGVLKVIDERVWKIWKLYYWPPHVPVSRIATDLGLDYHQVRRLVRLRPKVFAAWKAAGIPSSLGSS